MAQADVTTITRRGFFGHVAGAGTAALMGSYAITATHDPMLEALRKYRADQDWFNGPATDGMNDDAMNAARDASWGPFYSTRAGEFPQITTREGALEALRAVDREDAFLDDFAEGLFKAALAYFETA
jgi:hypothetical protein